MILKAGQDVDAGWGGRMCLICRRSGVIGSKVQFNVYSFYKLKGRG